MDLPEVGERLGRIQRSAGQTTRFKRVRGLQCYDEVYERLIHGHSPGSIARFVQEERGESLDVEAGSLEQQLIAFRGTLPKHVFVNPQTFPSGHQRLMDEVEEGLNVLDELTKLYRTQAERIEIDVRNEKAINKLMKGTGREIREARELLLSIHRVQSDLGLTPRHLGTANVNINQNTQVLMGGYGEQAAAVLNDPKKANNVLGVFKRVVQLGTLDDGGVLDVEADDDH